MKAPAYPPSESRPLTAFVCGSSEFLLEIEKRRRLKAGDLVVRHVEDLRWHEWGEGAVTASLKSGEETFFILLLNVDNPCPRDVYLWIGVGDEFGLFRVDASSRKHLASPHDFFIERRNATYLSWQAPVHGREILVTPMQDLHLRDLAPKHQTINREETA